MRTLKANGDVAQHVVVEVVKAFAANKPTSETHSCMQCVAWCRAVPCRARTDLAPRRRYAVMTSRAHIPDEAYKALEPLIGKYVH